MMVATILLLLAGKKKVFIDDDSMLELMYALTNRHPDLFYTKKQMYDLFKFELKKTVVQSLSTLLYLLGAIILFLLIMVSVKIAVTAGVLATGLLVLIGHFGYVAPLTEVYFAEILNLWLQAGKYTGNLISEPLLNTESLVHDFDYYQVKAIIVMDKDIHVDLLVRNGLHKKYKALIISQSLYPDYAVEPLENLLATSPALPVFFVHDADSDGTEMIRRFRKMKRMKTAGIRSHDCWDLGFFPADFEKQSLLRKFKKKTKVKYPSIALLPLSFLESMLDDHVLHKIVPSEGQHFPAQSLPASLPKTPQKSKSSSGSIQKALLQLREEYQNTKKTLVQWQAKYDELKVLLEQKEADYQRV